MDIESQEQGVLLVQTGARRDYELARWFEEQGRLARFVTTIAASESPKSWLSKSWTYSVARFSNRRIVRGVPSNKIVSSILTEVVQKLLPKLGIVGQRRKDIENYILGFSASKFLDSSSGALFTVDGNGGSVIRKKASSLGIPILADIVITPYAIDAVLEEAELWPGFDTAGANVREAERYKKHYRSLCVSCDYLLCPSEYVRDGLVSLCPEQKDKYRVVPYGLGGYEIRKGFPEIGRVLFSGSDALRKGLPYYARVATNMKYCCPRLTFCVAGDIPESVQTSEIMRDVEFLGKLSPARMREEYARADVFCLPSNAEGQAGAVLEALANGVPVVVTKETGSPIEDNVEGVIVARGAVEEIVGAIRRIVSHRQLRERMSEAALRRAALHTDENIAQQIIDLLDEVVSPQSVVSES